MYRDRAYCVLSTGLRSQYAGSRCANAACDRYADETVLRLALKANEPIGWADLKTSKCGFVPREGE